MGGTVGRIGRVRISESRNHPEAPVDFFPAVGYGIEKGEDPPPFPKKKEAKKCKFTTSPYPIYTSRSILTGRFLDPTQTDAAKCAVDWLIQHSYMPSNLKDVTFPRGHQPVRFVRPSSSESSAEDSAGEDGGEDGGGGNSGPATPPPPKKARKGPPSAADINDESLPATERVAALCTEMGMQPPVYRLDRSIPGTERYYDGYPDFGLENGSMPDGLGRVRKVEGRERARARIAEAVLGHLLSVYRERLSMFEECSKPLEGAAL